MASSGVCAGQGHDRQLLMLLRNASFWLDCERPVIDQTSESSWKVINFASSLSVDWGLQLIYHKPLTTLPRAATASPFGS